ncbi:hypothetical protein [Pseudomonas leptonychotis]|uniref:Uncharacterized protein n=1 Tax=Pseudomonas leptonychotis TaxID=2448482 RepID=A0A4V4R9C5_9PSED|nr:hypothetical protein [Pseudomonas leptonychotis]TIH07444.1 hypothetical protein D8779_14870 [Pseudomonas leptonychotis]
MFSLRNLLAPRRSMRSFALLDAQGICRALRQSTQAPQGSGWVEVQQSCLSWLNQPLPAGARTAQVTPCLRIQQMLAA